MKFSVEGDVQNVSRGGKTIDLSGGSYETDDPGEIAWLSSLPFMKAESEAEATKATRRTRRKQEVTPEDEDE